MNKNKELECILFCEFHPIAGPKIVYQVRCGFGTDTMPDGRTDRQTDTQTDRHTDKLIEFLRSLCKLLSAERKNKYRESSICEIKPPSLLIPLPSLLFHTIKLITDKLYLLCNPQDIQAQNLWCM